MGKVRLTRALRDRLMVLASEGIVCRQEAEARIAAYMVATVAVRGELVARFPQDEMEVLRKYDVARRDGCVRYSSGDNNRVYGQFYFDADDEAPLVPNHGSCRPYLFSDATIEFIRVYDEAVRAEKVAQDARLSDYRALVFGSACLEDVVAVWPVAEAARPQAMALVGVDPAVIARIRAETVETLVAR